MTFEKALERIQNKFTEIDASKLADMAVQVTLTDEDCGGTLYFKAANGAVDVQGYDYRDNDAVIDIQRKALMDILSGKTTLDKAVNKGIATVKGDFDKLDTLNTAIPKYVAPKAEPKTAVKTEAKPAKKTETKAAAKAEAKPAAVKAEVKEEKTAAPAKRKCCRKKTAKKTSK